MNFTQTKERTELLKALYELYISFRDLGHFVEHELSDSVHSNLYDSINELKNYPFNLSIGDIHIEIYEWVDKFSKDSIQRGSGLFNTFRSQRRHVLDSLLSFEASAMLVENIHNNMDAEIVEELSKEIPKIRYNTEDFSREVSHWRYTFQQESYDLIQDV